MSSSGQIRSPNDNIAWVSCETCFKGHLESRFRCCYSFSDFILFQRNFGMISLYDTSISQKKTFELRKLAILFGRHRVSQVDARRNICVETWKIRSKFDLTLRSHDDPSSLCCISVDVSWRDKQNGTMPRPLAPYDRELSAKKKTTGDLSCDLR